jgi:hypothetical protein
MAGFGAGWPTVSLLTLRSESAPPFRRKRERMGHPPGSRRAERVCHPPDANKQQAPDFARDDSGWGVLNLQDGNPHPNFAKGAKLEWGTLEIRFRRLGDTLDVSQFPEPDVFHPVDNFAVEVFLNDDVRHIFDKAARHGIHYYRHAGYQGLITAPHLRLL